MGVVLFLTLLFILVILAQLYVAPSSPTGPDVNAYLRIAHDQITQSNYWRDPGAFDDNFWSIAYPTLLAQVLRLSGGSLRAMVLFQVVLVGSLVPIPWILLRRLGIPIAVAGCLFLSVNPSFWSLGPSIGYEALLAWLLSYSLVAAWIVKTRHGLRTRWQVLLSASSGILAGLALLTQTKCIVVIPVLVFLLWRREPKLLLSGFIGLFAAIVPWIIRNLIVVGSPNPLSLNGPYNLWVGNNPENVNGGSMIVAPLPPIGQTQLSGAVNFIFTQPERWIELTFSKMSRLWEPVFVYPDALGAWRSPLHMWTGWLGLLLAAGFVFYVGSLILGPREPISEIQAPAIFASLFFVAHVPFIAEPRFMVSLIPVTSTIAAAYWCAVIMRIGRRSRFASIPSIKGP